MPVTDRMMMERKLTQCTIRTGHSHTYFVTSFSMASLLKDLDLNRLIPFRVHDVNRAGKTGVEGMHGAENLQRPLRIGNRRADEGRLVGTPLIFGVAGRGVPGG